MDPEVLALGLHSLVLLTRLYIASDVSLAEQRKQASDMLSRVEGVGFGRCSRRHMCAHAGVILFAEKWGFDRMCGGCIWAHSSA